MSLAHPVVEVLELRMHSNDTVCGVFIGCAALRLACVFLIHASMVLPPHWHCCTCPSLWSLVVFRWEHEMLLLLWGKRGPGLVLVAGSGASLSLSQCSIQAPVLVARSGTVLLSSRQLVMLV
jgi:hypothetical protein